MITLPYTSCAVGSLPLGLSITSDELEIALEKAMKVKVEEVKVVKVKAEIVKMVKVVNIVKVIKIKVNQSSGSFKVLILEKVDESSNMTNQKVDMMS